MININDEILYQVTGIFMALYTILTKALIICVIVLGYHEINLESNP